MPPAPRAFDNAIVVAVDANAAAAAYVNVPEAAPVAAPAAPPV